MRRYLTAICLVGLLGGGAGVALAAIPPTHTSFSGSGGNFWNSGGSWSRHGSGSFHLTTSGRYYYGVKKYYIYIKSFLGHYTSSCNSGTLKAGATWLRIHSNGSFNNTFHGRNTHGAWMRVWGQFTAKNQVKVNYLINFRSSDTNPNTVNSSCATWVHGTASS